MLCKRGILRLALSVCLSVTFVNSVKTNKHIFKIFSPSGSQTILVFPYQTSWQYSDGDPPNRGVECRWVGRNRDFGRTACYRLMTAAVRDQQVRPSTVHRRRRISESMFITASMDDHDEEKRTVFICTQR